MTGYITCLMCGGKGWVRTLSHGGLPHPVRCAGCHGTGKQKVAS